MIFVFWEQSCLTLGRLIEHLMVQSRMVSQVFAESVHAYGFPFGAQLDLASVSLDHRWSGRFRLVRVSTNSLIPFLTVYWGSISFKSQGHPSIYVDLAATGERADRAKTVLGASNKHLIEA